MLYLVLLSVKAKVAADATGGTRVRLLRRGPLDPVDEPADQAAIPHPRLGSRLQGGKRWDPLERSHASRR